MGLHLRPRAGRLPFLYSLAWLVALSGSELAASNQYYVAPTGSDEAPGTRQRPFATLQRARDVLREHRAADKLRGPVTVYVRGGRYTLRETLSLEACDSGTPAAPVTFRALPGERPILSGGRPVTGFAPHRGLVLRADLAAQGLGGLRPGVLVFDGRRQQVARSPNRDPDDPNGGAWAFVDGQRMSMYADRPDEDGSLAQNTHLDFWQRNIPRYTRTLQMRPEDARRWEHPEDGAVSIFPRFNWAHYVLPIETYDPETRTLHLGPGCFYEIRPGDRYFVQGHPEDLDRPGEWALDPRSDTLCFWPPEPLDGRPVYVAALQSLVTLTGCSDVTLRGFTLECCEDSGVVVKDCTRVVVAQSIIRNLGGEKGAGVVVEGGRDNRVAGNDISEIGSSGIRLGGGDLYRLAPGANVADNNHIHHVGLVGRDAKGIEVTGALHRISHNLIHEIPHSGIFMWGAGHTVEYNRLVRTCLESEDCGAIGGGAIDWLSWQGVVIRYNWLQDTLGFGYDARVGQWRSPYFAHALYPDWAASGVHIHGNVLVRAPSSCLYLHSGRDNVIENNILVDGGETQLTMTGWTSETGYWKTRVADWVRGYEAALQSPAWQQVPTLKDPREVPLPDGRVMTGNRFVRNIVCYRGRGTTPMQLRDVPLDGNEWDHNVYYHYGRPLNTGMLRAKAERGPNLLANPGVEEGPIGGLPAGWAWGLKANERTRLEVVGGTSHTGERSLLIAPGLPPEGATASQVGYVAPGPVQPFRPGQAYRLALWLKAEDGPVSLAVQAYAWKQNAHNWLTTSTVSAAGDWREYSLVFRLPNLDSPEYRPTMDTFCPRLAFSAGKGRAWVDDVSLREAETTSEWEAWRAAGMDRHSVIADPLFVDASRDDYRLRSGSPALRLGFEPIPVERIGCYKHPLRASWPLAAAMGQGSTGKAQP
jgi:hypothetical protein